MRYITRAPALAVAGQCAWRGRPRCSLFRPLRRDERRAAGAPDRIGERWGAGRDGRARARGETASAASRSQQRRTGRRTALRGTRQDRSAFRAPKRRGPPSRGRSTTARALHATGAGRWCASCSTGQFFVIATRKAVAGHGAALPRRGWWSAHPGRTRTDEAQLSRQRAQVARTQDLLEVVIGQRRVFRPTCGPGTERPRAVAEEGMVGSSSRSTRAD